MLRLPKGFGVSAKKHNVDLLVAADWVEASALVLDEEISQSDVVDVLLEQHIYRDEDFCQEFISDIWTELRRRHPQQGEDRLDIGRSGVVSAADWDRTPAWAFTLLSSHSRHYTDANGNSASKALNLNYAKQGELLETIAEAALGERWATWSVLHVGWSPGHTSPISDVIKTVADFLGDRAHEPATQQRWLSGRENDASLDLVLRHNVARSGPALRGLVQVASGGDWKDKRDAPNLDLWAKLVDFAVPPFRVLVTSESLDTGERTRHCGTSGGLILDRYELLPDEPEANWAPGNLLKDVGPWLTPLVDWLAEDALVPEV